MRTYSFDVHMYVCLHKNCNVKADHSINSKTTKGSEIVVLLVDWISRKQTKIIILAKNEAAITTQDHYYEGKWT